MAFRVALVAGHSRINDKDADFRRREYSICRDAVEVCFDALSGLEAVSPGALPGAIYNMPNDAALNHKVERINLKHREDGPIDLAVEFHLNGGGGDYSLAMHHENSKLGGRAAARFARIFGGAFAWPLWGVGGYASQIDMGRSGLAFLSRTLMPAVILEPGFLDNPGHLWETPLRASQYGLAAAVAIMGLSETLNPKTTGE